MMTGCRCRARSAPQTATSSSIEPARDAVEMPLPVPSATGLAKSGKRSFRFRASSADSTTAKSGVARPWPRTTCLATPLCSVTAQASGSENT